MCIFHGTYFITKFFALNHWSYLSNGNPYSDENFILNHSPADSIYSLLTPIYDSVILLSVPMTLISKPNSQALYAYWTHTKAKATCHSKACSISDNYCKWMSYKFITRIIHKFHVCSVSLWPGKFQFYLYHSGLFHWHCHNCIVSLVPVKWLYKIWKINWFTNKSTDHW